MKRLFQLITLVVVLSGCNKFEHTASLVEKQCTLCAFADSLTGTYEGLATGISVPSFYGNGTDSMTVTVEHIFLNFDQHTDSTVMFFKTTKKFHSQPYVYYDTVAICTSDGAVIEPEYPTYTINPQQIVMYKYVTAKYNYLVINYTGYKQ